MSLVSLLMYMETQTGLIAGLTVFTRTASKATCNKQTNRQKLWWAVALPFNQLLMPFAQNRSDADLQPHMKRENRCKGLILVDERLFIVSVLFIY